MRNKVQAVLILPHAECTSADSSAKPQTCLSKCMQMRELSKVLARLTLTPRLMYFYIKVSSPSFWLYDIILAIIKQALIYGSWSNARLCIE